MYYHSEKNMKSETQHVAKLFLILCVIFSAGTVLGVAVYLAKIKAIRNNQPQVSISPKPTSTPVVKDDTSDWKIYRNEEYGFEVKYPIRDWIISEYHDDNCFIVNNKDQKNCIYFNHTGVFGRIIINMSNFSAKENLNKFFEFQQQNVPELFRQKDAAEILLDGHKGYKVYSGGWGEVPEEGNTIYLEKDKISSFEISYSYSTDCYLSIDTADKTDPKFIECDKSVKEEGAMIDQILSTFRFIEDGTADWETYKNKDWIIKLPSTYEHTILSKDDVIDAFIEKSFEKINVTDLSPEATAFLGIEFKKIQKKPANIPFFKHIQSLAVKSKNYDEYFQDYIQSIEDPEEIKIGNISIIKTKLFVFEDCPRYAYWFEKSATEYIEIDITKCYETGGPFGIEGLTEKQRLAIEEEVRQILSTFKFLN